MRFNGETLKFDRRAKCDWCGKRTLVGITHYGTTHYNRLICEPCATEIKNKDKMLHGIMHDGSEDTLATQKKILDTLMEGCNADLPKNITKVFEDNKGTVKVYVMDKGTCIEYEGEIKGKTIKGRILSRSLKADCVRLAEDIAHFVFDKSYQDSKVKVKDAESDFELTNEGSETWRDYYESRDLNPDDYENLDHLSTYAATLLYKGQRIGTLKLLNYKGAKLDYSECSIIDMLKPLNKDLLIHIGASSVEDDEIGFVKDLNNNWLPYCPDEASARKCLMEQIVPQIEEALQEYKALENGFYKKVEKLISKLDNLAEEFGELIDEAPSKHQKLITDLYEEMLDQVKLTKTTMLYNDQDSHLYEE